MGQPTEGAGQKRGERGTKRGKAGQQRVEEAKRQPKLDTDATLDLAVDMAYNRLKHAEAAGGFAGARARQLRQYFEIHRVEERLSSCVQAVLSELHLRWSPYPSVIRMLRREEMCSSHGWPQNDLDRRQYSQRIWDEPSNVARCGMDSRLVQLSPHGACSAELVPVIDPTALERAQQLLQPTGLIAAFNDRIAVRGSADQLLVNATSAVGVSGLWAPRLMGQVPAIEVFEHFSTAGPPDSLEVALEALQTRITSTVLALDASHHHFVDGLEVYAVQGRGSDDVNASEADEKDVEEDSAIIGHEHDAAPLMTPTSGRLSGILHTRWARLLSFSAAELRTSPLSPACRRAIRAAALSGHPIYLHVFIAVAVVEEEGPHAPRRREDEPPQSKYISVQKSFIFAYTGASSGRRRAAMDNSSGPAVGFAIQGDRTEITPPALSLLFTCAWPEESEGIAYLALPENRRSAAAPNKAQLHHASFLKRQLSQALTKGQYMHVAEAAVLLLPHLNDAERKPLLPELAVFLSSDATVLAAIAHAFSTVARMILAVAPLSLEHGKGARAAQLLCRQWLTHCRELSRLLLAERWGDLAPLEPMLRRMMTDASDASGSLRLPADEHSRRELARRLLAFARAVNFVSRQMCDTLMTLSTGLSEFCRQVFAATADVQVPLSMQPPPMRERRIDLAAERERLKASRAYPPVAHNEAVLLQYVIDSRLDAAVEAVLLSLTSASRLPHNPFTSALIGMKRAAVAFEMWREDDDALVRACGATMLPAPESAAVIPGCLVCRMPPPASRDRSLGPRRRGHARGDAAAEALMELHRVLISEIRISADAVGNPCLYGHCHALAYTDLAGVLRLRRELGPEVIDVARHTVIQEYETFIFTAFVNVSVAMSSSENASPASEGRRRALPPYEVHLREDYVIRGSGLDKAIAIYCSRIVSAVVAMHSNTMHLVRSLAFGDQNWTGPGLAEFPKQATRELISYMSGASDAEVKLHCCVLIGAVGDDVESSGRHNANHARYVAMTKRYHFIFLGHSSTSTDPVVALPPRRMQSRRSIFLTHAHASIAMLVEAATGGCDDSRYRHRLLARGGRAWRGGDALAASSALLELGVLDVAAPPPLATVLAPVLRLFRSRVGRLAHLSHLGVALRSLIEACAIIDNKSKCSYGVLNTMLDTYRKHVLDFLWADECVNLEANRRDVQEAFFIIFEVLQAVGEPTSGCVAEQLQLCDDLLASIGAATAVQIIENAPSLASALDSAFGPANFGREAMKRSLSAGKTRSDGPKHAPVFSAP